jgi:hypothetical protein
MREAVGVGVGHDDLCRLLWRDAGIEDADHRGRDHAAGELRDHDPGTDAGAIPANVFENIRPTLIAGFAKLVELVNQ